MGANSTLNHAVSYSGSLGYIPQLRGSGKGTFQSVMEGTELGPQFASGFRPFSVVAQHMSGGQQPPQELLSGIGSTGLQGQGHLVIGNSGMLDGDFRTNEHLQQSNHMSQAGQETSHIHHDESAVFGQPLAVDNSSNELCVDAGNWQRGFNNDCGKIVDHHFVAQSDGIPPDYEFNNPFNLGLDGTSSLDGGLDFLDKTLSNILELRLAS
eukprot:Gb_01928 [translate_table: standard]